MRVDVDAVIKHVCRACGCPEIVEKGLLTVEFTDQIMEGCLGDAEWINKEGRGFIRLSSGHWDDLTETEQIELLVHEVCHCLDDYLYGPRKRKPHGKKWKSLMALAGIPGAAASI